MNKTFAILLILLGTIASGCSKNEFKVKARLDNADSAHSLQVTYHASDKRKGRVVRFDVPLVDGRLDITGYTRLPTVVWLASAGGAELTWVYVERGEKINIEGDMAEPASWRVEGNQVNHLLTRWRKLNAGLLRKGDPAPLNARITEFVIKNPDSPASALLLLNSFDRHLDPGAFASLWGHLGPDARKEEMVRASGADPADVEFKPSGTIKELTLYTSADSLATFRASDARATILGFVHGDEPRRAALTSFLTSMAASEGVRAIEVSMARDYTFWRHTLAPSHLTSPVTFAWVPGGKASAALQNIPVGATPWYVTLTPRGVVHYCGPDSAKARASVNKL